MRAQQGTWTAIVRRSGTAAVEADSAVLCCAVLCGEMRCSVVGIAMMCYLSAIAVGVELCPARGYTVLEAPHAARGATGEFVVQQTERERAAGSQEISAQESVEGELYRRGQLLRWYAVGPCRLDRAREVPRGAYAGACRARTLLFALRTALPGLRILVPCTPARDLRRVCTLYNY